jgi:DNA primase
MREHVLALVQRHLPGPFRPSGATNVITKCPFHKGGEERKPSFSINLNEGLFHCFTCHEAGTVKTLLKKLQVPASSIDAELAIIKPHLDAQRRIFVIEKENQFVNRDPFLADYVLPEALLGVYELCPQKLIEDGFDQNLLKEMEVGYDRHNNRIMYPLRDMYGNLAGFSGGVTPWTTTKTDKKYLVYQGRRKGFDGKRVKGDFGDWFDEQFPDYRCENHDFLWNYDKVFPRIETMSEPNPIVYVVEGFKACLWMIQAGFRNTVALMGSYISDRQRQMLERLGCTVVLCLDNDEPGMKATLFVGDSLWRPLYGRVMVMPYPEEDEKTQPDDYEAWAVHHMVENSRTYLQYINNRRRGLKW